MFTSDGNFRFINDPLVPAYPECARTFFAIFFFLANHSKYAITIYLCILTNIERFYKTYKNYRK